MISIYRACKEAELADDYETLPDANDTMLTQLKYKLQHRMTLFNVIRLAIKENTEKLAMRIYSFYSRLSALRDELRIAGLVKI